MGFLWFSRVSVGFLWVFCRSRVFGFAFLVLFDHLRFSCFV